MFSLGIPLLVLVIVIIILVARSNRPGHAPHELEIPEGRTNKEAVDAKAGHAIDEELQQKLSQWVTAGLISVEESKAILGYEAAPKLELVPPIELPRLPGRAAHRIPPTAEALGYLGGVLVIVGLVLIATRYWPDLNVAARLALSGVVTAALIAAGAVVHESVDPALARFRWFLWLTSSATTALFVAILSREQFHSGTRAVVMVSAAATALESGLLWNLKSRPLQQVVFLGALATAGGAAAATVFPTARVGPAGIVVWTIGLIYLYVGLRRYILGSLLTESVAVVAILAGALMFYDRWETAGLFLQLASAIGLVALAEIPGLLKRSQDRLVTGVAGAIASFEAVPAALTFYAHDAGIVTGAITWVVGLGLIGAGSKGLARSPNLAKLIGGIMVIGGAALTGAQSRDVAPIFGLVSAIALVILGTRPGQVLMSAIGSIGILINVTWGISWFFPSEGRAPLIILVAGILAIAIAVWMTRIRGRFARELSFGHRGNVPEEKNKRTGTHGS